MTRNKIFFIGITIVLLAVVFLSYAKVQMLWNKTAVINGKTITLDIAKTPDELQKGLSIYDKLPSDKGMLFLFNKPGRYQFWMKDMKFPIDIIYLDNEKVVTIFENVPHKIDNVANLNLYQPTQPATRVLELNAGKSKELKLKEGDTIKLNI